tara:strand:- start:1024 stop:1638 length:615 start_codon:yes stop_codon:yes gene_type:complete
MRVNNGAMFGLDARIALAIFGALSVISGAALYSAIQSARATQLITSLNELGKAYEAYLLDTGSELEIYSNVYGKSIHLVQDNSTTPIPGWNGPYFQADEFFSGYFIKHPYYQSFALIDFAEDSDWASASGNRASGAQCTTANTVCYAWVRIQGEFPLSLMQEIDKRIDGDDSAWTGNLRYRFKSSVTNQEVYLKYMPAFNQPNK